MKGIILAGGAGTRLYPATKVITKQLLPVFDKPMIYYPLSTLLLAGIKEIMIISTPEDTPRIEKLLGSGEELGIKLSYCVQDAPRGIAEAFILAEDFIGDDSVSLILGDNIFYGNGLGELLEEASSIRDGGVVFGYAVRDPQRFGVVEFNKKHEVISIEEKPEAPKSQYAVVGLYFYDRHVVEYAKALKPSKRGELEITDLNNSYLREGKLNVKLMGRGYAWLDTGTTDSLVEATNFIKSVEDRQGLKIGCIEEIAWRKNFIDTSQLIKLGDNLAPSPYGEYLLRIAKEDNV
jgi:glucose-1-phosphate thymidylyltransferase